MAETVLEKKVIKKRKTENNVTCGIWDRFETSIANPKTYQNPFTDITLNTSYTRPDGSQVHFWGFYDGGSSWKIRFMPDQLGAWAYQAVFSDGSGEVSGTFECVASELPGMIYHDEANPQWFGFKGGKHLVLRSFHVGDRFFAMDWPESKREAFLDWAQQQKYNMLSIASHYLKRNTPTRGAGWDIPDLWPLNVEHFQFVEKILDDMAKRGIMVYPFAGFFGRASAFPTSPSDQEVYIRYTLARLGSYWNIVLLMGGPEPDHDDYLYGDEVNRLGRLIKSMDVFGHLLSVHNCRADLYKDEAWTSYGIVQGLKTLERKKLSNFLLKNHHSSKPLFAQETLWPGNTLHPDYSDDDIRKNALVSCMCATSFCFADMEGKSSSGFSGSMELTDCKQERHEIVAKVWDFFESIGYYEMRPRPDLVTNGYCLTATGKEYLVYLEEPGTVHVSIHGGSYEVEWIDARDTSRKIKGSISEDGKNLTTPDGGEDWLLHLVLKDKNK